MRLLLPLALSSVLLSQIPEITGRAVEAFTLRYIDAKPGEGAPAEAGKRYTVHYTGWLADGTKFDSSLDRREPIRFVQGRRMVIAGWEAGFEGMKTGGKRRLLIPWQLAYGEKGSGPIPPRADLTFDVELIAVEDAPDLLPGADVMEPLRDVERKILALGRAVPEDKLSWRPGHGVRSFREVLLHLAYANTLMLDIGTNRLGGEALKHRIAENEKNESRNLSKDEILKLLEASFEPVRRYLETARAGNLATEVTFFGTPLTRRGVLVFLDTHASEHLGQLIAYARVNGIAPPWS
jgi:uncharacterized damage-inducible protein DinB